MKSNITKILLTLILVAAFCNKNAFTQTVSEKSDALFTSPQNLVNGNILVAENGRVIYKRSFGFADAKNKLPNNENSRFELASITKTFTSTAILQLRDEGEIEFR